MYIIEGNCFKKGEKFSGARKDADINVVRSITVNEDDAGHPNCLLQHNWDFTIATDLPVTHSIC